MSTPSITSGLSVLVWASAARLVRVGGVPLGPADGAQQHGVAGLAALDEAVFHGRAEGVDGAAAHDAFFVGEQVAVAPAGRVEHLPGGGDDLGAHPVAGEGHDAVAAVVSRGRHERLPSASCDLTYSSRPPRSMSSCMNGGNASAPYFLPCVRFSTVPAARSTRRRSPVCASRAASGHTTIGRPVLMALR